MSDYPTNEERTKQYEQTFSIETVLSSLVAKSDPTVFDVGANVGQSVELIKSIWKNATVHCFEPQASCLERLRSCAQHYEKQTVLINEFGLSNVAMQEANFFIHERSTGLAGFNKFNFSSKDSIDLRTLKGQPASVLDRYKSQFNDMETVSVLKAEDYIRANNIESIDFLKIDTQGHEPEVLEGFGAELSRVHVIRTEIMFYDLYDRQLSFSDIEALLHPYGFRLFDISHIAKNPMNGRTDWVDAIYVNQNFSE